MLKDKISSILNNNRHICVDLFYQDYEFIFDDICNIELYKTVVDDEYDEVIKVL